MLRILSKKIENGYVFMELSEDGVNVSHTVKTPVPNEVPIDELNPIEQQPTLEEVAQSTLLETQYQTVLIEMLAGF